MTLTETFSGDVAASDAQAATAAKAPLVHLSGLGLTLPSGAGPVEILKDVNLEIGAGETVSVVGPSGSGQTSLLMLMAGLERPTEGRVALAGEDISDWNEDRLATFRGQNLGIVFQHFHLIPTMTALENTAIPLELVGRGDAFSAAETALGRVGLGHRITHYPGQLSGGEQQRVALARALAPGPRLLLADEPTGNLDGATGGEIVELLFSLAQEEEATLVLITHDPALAARCSRQLSLANGRLVGDERR